MNNAKPMSTKPLLTQEAVAPHNSATLTTTKYIDDYKRKQIKQDRKSQYSREDENIVTRDMIQRESADDLPTRGRADTY